MGPSPKLVHTRRRHYALAHQKTSRTFGKCKTNTRRRRRLRGRVNDQNSDLGNQNDKAKKKHTSQNLLQRERESLELLLVAESRVRRHQTFVAIRCAPFRVSKKHLQLLLDLSWETSVSECFSDNWNFVCVCSVDIRIFILTVITTLKG